MIFIPISFFFNTRRLISMRNKSLRKGDEEGVEWENPQHPSLHHCTLNNRCTLMAKEEDLLKRNKEHFCALDGDFDLLLVVCHLLVNSAFYSPVH